MLTLYTTALSANGRKPLAVARHLDIDIQVVPIDVYQGEGRTEEYLAVNPTGKIPSLVDDGLTLTESNAILLHLDERYGGHTLSGSTPQERSQLYRWLFWEASQWQPGLIGPMTPFVGHVLMNRGPNESSPPPVLWDDPDLSPLLSHLEAHLGETEWLVGPVLTLADFSVGGMLTYFRRASFPFQDHPAISRWFTSLEALPAWQASADPLWQ